MIPNAVVTAVRQASVEDEWSGTTTNVDRWTGQHKAYYTEEIRSSAGQGAAGGAYDVARTRRELIVFGGLPVQPAVGDRVEFVKDKTTRSGVVQAVAGPRGTPIMAASLRTTKLLLGDE